MFRIRRVELKEGGFDLLNERRVQVAAYGPVVIVVGRRGGDYPHLVGIDFASRDQLVPNRGIEYATIGLASLDPCRRGVVRTGIGDAFEELLGIDAVLDHEVARHQAAGGRRHGAKRKGLAFQVLQGLDLRIGSDEFTGEFLVLFPLYQWDRIAGLQVGLDEGEAAKPGQVEAVGREGFDHRSVIGNRGELDRHTQFFLEVLAQRLELADQFGRGFVGNGRYAKDVGSMGGGNRQRKGKAGNGCQGALQHCGSPVQ